MLSMLESRKFRDRALQTVFLLVLAGVIGGAIYEGRQNLATQGLNSGFAFLDRATGFDIGFKLIDYTPYSSYGRLIVVGLLNTLFLGILGIVLANLVGLIIAILRTARNETFNALGTIYIEIFRNIPMILQAVFWYALLTQLPPPKQALQGFGVYAFFAWALSARPERLWWKRCDLLSVPVCNVGRDHDLHHRAPVFAHDDRAAQLGSLGNCDCRSWSGRDGVVLG